jgi:hypothetical protein
VKISGTVFEKIGEARNSDCNFFFTKPRGILERGRWCFEGSVKSMVIKDANENASADIYMDSVLVAGGEG